LEKFPVKFPVRREDRQSRGASALLRQPASPVSRVFPNNIAEKPAVGGLLALAGESPGGEIDIFSARRTENLRASSAKWPISGETSWRLVRHSTARRIRRMTGYGISPDGNGRCYSNSDQFVAVPRLSAKCQKPTSLPRLNNNGPGDGAIKFFV
jgi:hypothetical protein